MSAEMSYLYTALPSLKGEALEENEHHSGSADRSCSITKIFEKVCEYISREANDYFETRKRRSALAALQEDGMQLGDFLEWQNDEEMVRAAFNQNQEALQYASEQPVLAILKENGSALAYAPIYLRQRRDFIRVACEKDLRPLQFALHVDTVASIVRKQGINEQTVSLIPNSIFNEVIRTIIKYKQSLTKDEVAVILKKNGLNLQLFSQYQDDREIVQIACQQNKRALQFAGKSAVLSIVEKDGMMLQHAKKEHREDSEMIRAACKNTYKAVQYALNREEIVSLIKDPTLPADLVRYIPKQFMSPSRSEFAFQ